MKRLKLMHMKNMKRYRSKGKGTEKFTGLKSKDKCGDKNDNELRNAQNDVDEEPKSSFL